MIITVAELKNNPDKDLELAAVQDICITSNEKSIDQQTLPFLHRLSVLDNLVGILPAQETIDMDSIRKERLERQ